jgi:hypothetical protein
MFSKAWIEAILRTYGGVAVDLIEVHSMEGDGTAVAVNKHHNIDPCRRFPSLCFIDGDSRQSASAENLVFRLPGESPEAYIYEEVCERLSEFAGILAVALHCRYENHQTVSDVVQSIRRTNRDPHTIYSQVGRALGLLPEATVRGAFLSVWTQAYPEKVQELLEPMAYLLPKETRDLQNIIYYEESRN